MKVLIAPNAMKGTLSALEFSHAIEEGLRNSGLTQLEKVPIADGGDDTAQILAKALQADFISCEVQDPLGRKIQSGYYLSKDKIAIVEMALSSGLKLLEESEYSAIEATSFGTGEIIMHAIKHGAKSIILGVGGSASVDAGMGALLAMGFGFFDGRRYLTKGTGLELGKVVSIDSSELDERVKKISITLLCDVKNPLLGDNGAAKTFAPQKGASTSDVKKLQKNLALFAGTIFQSAGVDVANLKGGGAAGGIAASFFALLNNQLVDGAAYLLEKSKFYQKAKLADCIITGEGMLDETSFSGKACGAILNFGMKIDKPVHVICGVNKLKGENNIVSINSLESEYCHDQCSLNKVYHQVVSIAELLGERLKMGNEK